MIMAFIAIPIICISCVCSNHTPVPIGDWESCLGQPDISIIKNDSGGYSAVVCHKTFDGGICPVAYPIMETVTGAFIQAEGRIILSYDSAKDRLFLSPGGKYHRKHKSNIVK